MMAGRTATGLTTSRRGLAGWIAGAGITAMAPAGTAMAGRAALTLPEGCTVEWRRNPLGIDTRRPRFRWTLQSAPEQHDVRQAGFRIRVFAQAGAGKPVGTVVFDTGFVRSDTLAWTSPRDLPLVSQAGYEWRLALHDGTAFGPEVIAGMFVTGILDPDGWRAGWIAAQPDGAAPSDLETACKRATGSVMPLFRHDFAVPSAMTAAYLSIAGLGHHACLLNGRSVQGDDLSGGWTDFATSVLYDTYDVTALLKSGSNAIAVMLGNGFFNVEDVAGRYTKLARSSGPPRLIAQLRIVLADGREQLVASSADWRARPGPITYSSIYGGEDFDARRVGNDWSVAATTTGWTGAHQVAGPGGRLVANGVPTVTRTDRLTGTSMPQLGNGNLRHDFGINFAGRPRITLRRLRPGQVVTLWPGELLLADGSIDQQSMTELRPGRNGLYFRYIARGDAEETWEPRFTYTGFRYMEIEGIAADQLVEVEGCVLHADLARTGSFDCSDPRLVAVHKLIERALVSNMTSVLTDCPHREKLGWLEQIYLNAATVNINRNAVTLYEKMAGDMRAAQRSDGMVPSIAPEYAKFLNEDGTDSPFRDSPEWGSAIILGPWTVYRSYGDTGILRQNWAAMVRYVDYLAGRAKDGLVAYGLGDWFDIGPRPSGVAQLTSLEMTGTATLFANLDAMAQMAKILGKDAEARGFAARASATRATINARLYHPASGNYDRGSQAANAMALALGLAPASDRAHILANLIAAIRVTNNHVTAGDIGFHYVVRALIDAQRGDVLYDMLTRTDAPSYLAQIEAGATALTEAWDSTRGKSQNHFMLGHIEQWFYGGLAGLNLDFSRQNGPPILLAPQYISGITAVSASLQSVLGKIECCWRAGRGRMQISAALPSGCSAHLKLPVPRRYIISGSLPLDHDRNVAVVEEDSGYTVLKMGSGAYNFHVPIPGSTYSKFG